MMTTAQMIAGLRDTLQRLESIAKRTDPDRRRELIDARRIVIQQLWQLKSHASGPACAADPALKQELAKQVSTIWREIALIQASWPATTLDRYANDYRLAMRKTKATIDAFLAWAGRNIPPVPASPREPRNVS